jgi:hypothetical protein
VEVQARGAGTVSGCDVLSTTISRDRPKRVDCERRRESSCHRREAGVIRRGGRAGRHVHACENTADRGR